MKGKRPIEIKEKYLKELETKVNEIIKKFHSELFSEEYDYIYDTNNEAQLRANGTNPMNEQYVKNVEEKREALGVSQLRDNGLPKDYSSERYIHKLVFTFLEELKEKAKISENKTKGDMKEFLKGH